MKPFQLKHGHPQAWAAKEALASPYLAPLWKFEKWARVGVLAHWKC